MQVPFGSTAFFPGQLQDTGKVWVDRRLAGDAAPASSAAQQLGSGDGSLVQLPTVEAAQRLAQVLAAPAKPAAQPAQQQQQPPQQQQEPVGACASSSKPPAAAVPAQQVAAPQLEQLVEGQTPEQLAALRAALQQLGARLDTQAVAEAGAAGTEVGARGEGASVFPSLPSRPLCVAARVAASRATALSSCQPGHSPVLLPPPTAPPHHVPDSWPVGKQVADIV